MFLYAGVSLYIARATRRISPRAKITAAVNSLRRRIGGKINRLRAEPHRYRRRIRLVPRAARRVFTYIIRNDIILTGAASTSDLASV